MNPPIIYGQNLDGYSMVPPGHSSVPPEYRSVSPDEFLLPIPFGEVVLCDDFEPNDNCVYGGEIYEEIKFSGKVWKQWVRRIGRMALQARTYRRHTKGNRLVVRKSRFASMSVSAQRPCPQKKPAANYIHGQSRAWLPLN